MKKYIFILFISVFISCNTDEEKVKLAIEGAWIISYIDDGYNEVDIRGCLYSSSIVFYENGKCNVPLLKNQCIGNRGSFSSIRSEDAMYEVHQIDGCYYLTFQTQNQLLNGVNNIMFKSDNENKLLTIHVFSDNTYFVASKLLVNYDSKYKQIIELESITGKDCKNVSRL